MMTKARLLRTLGELATEPGGEKSHALADAALLDYIGDAEISAAYTASNPGWCA